MKFQSGTCPSPKVTQTTLVWPRSRMCYLVIVQRRFCCCCVIAEVALVWPLSRVTPLMRVHAVDPRGGIRAEPALEGFLPRVRSRVAYQHCSRGATVSAHPALKASLLLAWHWSQMWNSYDHAHFEHVSRKKVWCRRGAVLMAHDMTRGKSTLRGAAEHIVHTQHAP